MKRIIALLLCAAVILSFTACVKDEKKSDPTGAVEETVAASAEPTQGETDTAAHSGVQGETDESASEAVSTSAQEIPDDPSKWTAEQTVEFYKTAAGKSSKVKSTQVMVLEELIINDGDGVLGFFIKILEPAIASVIEKNAFEFDGITGGYWDLTAADAKSIKAYKSGDYTVIEMTMKNQTDGIYADAFAGSVGHAVTVLGDVSKAVAEFPQFEVDFENADIDVHYVNASVKVKINKNGVIEEGEWKYTCDPEIKHLDISGIMIDKADAKIDYIITVGK